MAKTHLPKRTYQSSRRQESAQLTRQAIARAALQLFSQRGYRGASIDAIAEAAAVAPETIYATFGGKRELLHYLIDTSVGGDEQPVRVIDRPEQQAVLHEPDARRLLAGFSEGVAGIMERTAPVLIILAEAAKTEPELAALQARLRAERLDNLRVVAQALARLAPLRVTEAQAADYLWSLTSPELYTLLTVSRQWSRQEVAAWLQASLERLLFQNSPGNYPNRDLP